MENRLENGGCFILIYSNFSESIGLVEDQFINNKADKHKLILKEF